MKTFRVVCCNPTLRECEDETHTPEMGTWESSWIPETLKFDCMGQNTLHWGVIYIIEKLLKSGCRKWARMGHLDIYSTCYDKKSRIDSTSVRAGGVRHTIKKLLRRATSLL
jgi:hypothetical protein